MFDVPKVIETEVFAEIPQALRKTDVPAERLAAGRGAPPAGCGLEGPSFDRDGNLYFVDNVYGRIFKADKAGKIEVVIEYEGEPNGLKIHKDGRIFIADFHHGIMVLDPKARTIKTLVARYMTEHFRGVNDLVFTRNGDLYFTDQGQSDLADPKGRVFCLTAAGQLKRVMDNGPSPNGLVFNHEEDILFVAMTRANAIWRLPLAPGGAVSRMGVFIPMMGGLGPDGMAAAEDGSLAVAHPGMGVVWVFSARGEPLYRVQCCRGDKPTNVAYGGPDRRTLYITENSTGAILTAKMPTPGRAMYSHQ